MELTEPILFRNRCDASGGVSIDEASWVGANDEENTLQLYSAAGGVPSNPALLGLNKFLGIPDVGDDLEADLESATVIDDVIFWLASHSQSKKGKLRPHRHRLFATRIRRHPAGVKLEPQGVPCTSLRETLLADPRMNAFGLTKAATIAPKEPDGFNLEAICASPDGQRLWVGFRNPIPQEGALLVGIENPKGITEAEKPSLAEPILVKLDGLGFRDMVWTGSEYLILAGDFRDRAEAGAIPSQLFRWSGPGTDPVKLGVEFGTLNPEALIHFPNARVLIVSDDGTRPCDGTTICKDVADETKKCFRAAWFVG